MRFLIYVWKSLAGAAGLGPLKMAICKQAITANAKWVHSNLLVLFKW